MRSANDDLAPHWIRRHSTKLVALATSCLTLFAGASAFGQVLRGQAAMGDWRDDKPGLRRLITAGDLPAVAKPTTGQAKVVPMPPDARPQLPDGFTAELVTTTGGTSPSRRTASGSTCRWAPARTPRSTCSPSRT
jgi:hypothetical protein